LKHEQPAATVRSLLAREPFKHRTLSEEETDDMGYGVATISRLLKMIGLFCKRALSKRRYSAKETYNFKEPTNRSHPITR